MSLFSFNWRRWLRGQKTKPYRKSKARKDIEQRLKVEQLETRYAPATFTWDGGATGNANWTTGANWVGDVAPTGTITDELVFPSGPTSLVTNNDFNGATFGRITISGSNYQLGGNPLTLGSPSGTASGEILVSGANANIGSGLDITMAVAAGTRQFITVQNGADLTVTSRLATASSGVELTKAGTGTLILSGANTGFTGLFTIDNNSGIVAITNASALGDQFQGTRVGQNSQLQLRNVAGQILEPLTLLGPGVANDGALLNLSGNSTWAGAIALDADSTIGASAGVLTISGQIGDLGAGRNLTKDGPGQVIFTRDNTYRGTTTINNGILTIQTGNGLGTGDGTAATSTIVNSSVTGNGTLQLQYVGGGNPDAGFTVRDELITINGNGFGGIGSLHNLTGNNIWGERIVIGSQFPNGSNVSIGSNVTGLFNNAALGLNVQGSVIDQVDLVGANANNRIFNITKVGTGRIILSNNNPYRGTTTIQTGTITIRDSGALGTGGTTVVVNNLGALEYEVDTGFDVHGRNLGADSVTGTPNRLNVARGLNIAGRGANNDGALRNVSGINIQTGNISLGNVTNNAVAAIGVEPDPNQKPDITYFTNDYSLTVNGVISGGPLLAKRGTGHLIVTAANTYTGQTDIEQGWITLQNERGLGGRLTRTDAQSNVAFQIGDTQQPFTRVFDGAALHLRPLAGNITLAENLELTGQGLVHPFTLISQKGALMSLAGNNNVGGPLQIGANFTSSDIRVNGQVPIGVENPFGGASELTVTARVFDGVAPGGITKLGSRRMIVQGPGTYTGAMDIREGVLRIQNDTGLGLVSTGTLVGQQNFTQSDTIIQAGAALEIAPSVAQFNGGFATGIQTWSERLVINGAGNTSVTGALIRPVVNMSDDVMWRGPVSLGTTPFTVQFQSTLGLRDLRNMTADATGLIGGSPAPSIAIGTSQFGAVGTTNAIQSITFGGVISSGTFTLSFGGSTTTPITWSSNPTTLRQNIQNALDALTTIGAGNSVVAVGNSTAVLDVAPNSRLTLYGAIDDRNNAAVSGTDLVKINTGELVLGGINDFRGTLNINAGVLTVSNSRALGGTGTGEVQTVTVSGPGGSMFGLTYDGQTTGNIFDANTLPAALTVQNALNALTSIANVGGQVTVTGPVAGVYTVGFNGTLAGFDLTDLQFTQTGGATVTIGTEGTGAPGAVDGAGGTVIANSAQIQLQGSITVAGEPLTVQGVGATAPNYTPRWFGTGPGPINSAQTPGRTPATGRITGVAVDPSDPNVIYTSAAGGGAWKTEDGGVTWEPLLDMVSGAPFQVMFTGAIAVAPSDPRIVYVATGEPNNSGDSYYGRGILKSTDSGRTWTLMQGNTNEFDRRTINKIVVDPARPHVVYVAVNGAGSGVNSVAGNGGIWVSDTSVGSPTWTNLIFANPGAVAGDDAAVIFSPFDDYTDVLVLRDPYVTTFPNDIPARPDNRFIFMAVGTASGFNPVTFAQQNAVYTSTTFNAATLTFSTAGYFGPPEATQTTIWTRNNFPLTETLAAPMVGNASRNGVIRLAASYVTPAGLASGQVSYGNPVGVPGPGSGSIRVYAAVSYPDLYPALATGPAATVAQYQQLRGTFREINSMTITFNSNTPTFWWTRGTWGSSTTPNAPITGPVTTPAVLGTLTNFPFGQGNYDLTIGADRTDPNGNTLYLAGVGGGFTIGPMRSTDGGQNWTDLGSTTFGPHADAHAISFDSLGRPVFGTDGGLWRFNGIGSWTNLNGNLAITQFNGIAVHPTDPNFAIGGSQDNGTERYTGSPAWQHVDDGDGGVVQIDQRNPNIAYHVLNGILRKSVDSGATWSTVTGGGYDGPFSNLYFPFVVDNVNTNRVVVGGGGNFTASAGRRRANATTAAGSALQESLDNAGNWINLTPTPAAAGQRLDSLMTPSRPGGTPVQFWYEITNFALAQYQGAFVADAGFGLVTNRGDNTYDPDTIYAIVQDRFGEEYVVLTKDHAQSWVDRTAGLPNAGGAGIQAYTDILVDPRNRDTVYIVRNQFTGPGTGKVFKTTDAGLTWADISAGLPDLPAWKIVIDPRNGDLYLGTDNGVWKRTNGIGNWARFGAALPNVQVTVMELNQTVNTLTVGTYGRSMYQIFLQDGQPPSTGAFRAVSGTNVWTGPIALAGATSISAGGTQALQNGVSTAALKIDGRIRDVSFAQTLANTNTITKAGQGDVIFAGSNSYGGVTNITEGVLVVQNPSALGASGATANTNVANGTALQIFANLNAEQLNIRGNGISFNGVPTGAIRNVANNNTFTGSIVLEDHSTIGVDSSSSLLINGLNPTITDGAGTFNLIKELTGTLILASASNYDGQTFINQGALQIRNGAALGAGGAAGNRTTVADGAQLQVQGGITTTEFVTLTGTGIFGTGALLNTGGNNDWAGAVTLIAPTVTIGTNYVGDELKVSGVVDGAAALNKVGPGRLTFSGNNTYAGATNVNAGTLRLQGAGKAGNPNTFPVGTTVATGASFELENLAGALGGETLTLNGSGISEAQFVDVSGTAGTFTLTFNSATTSGLPFNTSAGAIQAALNGLASIGGLPIPGSVSVAQAGTSPTPGATRFTITFGGSLAGTNVSQVTTNGGIGGTTSTTGMVVIGPDSLVADGGKGVLRNIAGTGANQQWAGPIVLNTDSTFGIEAGTALIVSSNNGIRDPWLGVPANATHTGSTLTKIGTGTLILQDDNTYTGSTDIREGVVNIRNATALGLNGPEIQTVAVLGTSGTFRLTVNIPGVGSATTAPLSANPLESPANVAAALNTALNALDADITGNPVTATLTGNVYRITFGGVLLGRNIDLMTSGGLTGGASFQAFTTIADGSGGTTVQSGATLEIQGGIVVGVDGVTRADDENLVLNGTGVGGAGALNNISGTNRWLSSTVGLPWESTITLGSNTTIGSVAGSLEIATPIGEASAGFTVTKVGAGTLEYQAANTYTGLTTVNDGLLRLNNTTGNSLAGNLTVGDGTGLADSARALLVNLNEIPNTADVIVQSDGQLDMGGLAETVGTVTIQGGEVTTGAAGTLLASTISMVGGNLTIGAGAAVATTGNFNMTGGQVDIGATGSLSFGGTFNTNASASTAIVQGTGNLDVGATQKTFNVANGTAVADLRIAVPVVGAGGILKTGAGLLDLDGTYAGTTTINAGIFQADGTAGPISLNGGTLAGTGTVGTVTSTATGGTVNPGNSPERLDVNGNVTWNAATTYFVEIDTSAVPDHDEIVATGTIDIAGATLSGAITGNPAIGTSYTILTAATINNEFAEFAGFDNTAYINGRKFTVLYLPNGAAPDTVVITRARNRSQVTVTPSTGPLASPAFFGQPLTFNITVSSNEAIPLTGLNPSGNVVVTFTNTDTGANEIQTLGLTAGQATFTPTLPLNAANYSIAVTYGTPPYDGTGVGDGDFSSSQFVATPFVISPAATTTNLLSGSNPSVFSEQVTFTATVARNSPGAGNPGAPRTVDFFVNGLLAGDNIALVGNVATFNYTHPNTGTYTVTAHFNGAIITSASTTTGVNTVTVGSAANIEVGNGVSGPGIPNGTTVTSVAGTTITLSNNATATATGVNLKFFGDPNFLASDSSSTITETVNAANTTTAVTTSLTPSTYGQNVTFTTTVTANAPAVTNPTTGTVTLFVNGTARTTNTLSGSNQTTFVVGDLGGNTTHVITAQYNGTPNHNASALGTLAGGQTVNRATPGIVFNPAPANSVFGNPVTFTVTVSKEGVFTNGLFPSGAVRIFNQVARTGSSTISTNVLNITDALGTTGLSVGMTVLGAGIPANTTITGIAGTNVTISNNATATGAGVVFTFNGQIGTDDVLVEADSGVATFNVSNLPGGTYNLFARYVGDTNYFTVDSSTRSHNVTPAATAINTFTDSPDPTKFGQLYTLTATVVSTPATTINSGTVQFKDLTLPVGSQVIGTASVINNTATLQVNSLPVGTRQLTAQYITGSSDYASSAETAAISHVTELATTGVSISSSANSSFFGQDVVFTAIVSALSPSQGTPTAIQPDGFIRFVVSGIGGGTFDRDLAGATSTTSSAQLTISGLGIGSHSVTAEYHPESLALGGATSGNFAAPASATALSPNQTVIASNTAVALTPASQTNPYGQGAVTATVTRTSAGTGDPTTGTVMFFVTGTTGSVNVPVTLSGSNTAVLQNPPLNVVGSPYTITAQYQGNAPTNSFNSSAVSGSVTQTVTQATANVVLTSVDPTPSFGETFTFLATVNRLNPGFGIPTGTVTFFVGGTQLGTPKTLSFTGPNGTATSDPITLPGGAHDVRVNFDSDNNNFADQIAAGGAVTITPAFNVGPATPTVAVSGSPSTPTFGDTITLTASVTSPNPGVGTITFFVDNVQSGTTKPWTGGASVQSDPISGLSGGVHLIRAEYDNNGATNFNDATSGNQNFTVNPILPTVTISNPSPASPGVFPVSPTFTVLVNSSAGQPGSGNVSFFVDGTLSHTKAYNGAAVTSDPIALQPGARLIRVDYDNGANTSFQDASSANFSYQVNVNPTVSVTPSSASPTTYGQSITFTADVTSNFGAAPGRPPTGGTVTFFVDGVQSGTVKNWTGAPVVSDAITNMPASATAHTVTATYSGFSFYTTQTGSANHTINKATPQVLDVETTNANAPFGSPTITARVLRQVGGLGNAPTGTVTFDVASTIGGGTFQRTVSAVAQPDGSALATLDQTLNVGNYNITASYNGDSNYNAQLASDTVNQTITPVATTATLTATPPSSVFGQNVTFTVTVTPNSGSATPTGTVVFTIDGNAGSPMPLNGSGQASTSTSTLTVSGSPHTILVTYTPNTGNFTGDTDTRNHTVNQANTTATLTNGSPNPSVPGQAVTFTATVSAVAPGAGTPPGTVDFFVDGVLDTINGNDRPLSSGTATYTTSSLASGARQITAQYNGDANFAVSPTSGSVTQNVDVLPVANPGGPYAVNEGANTLVLNGSASSDADGTINQYQWDFGNNGSFEITTASATVPVTWASLNTFGINDGNATIPVALRVTDNLGGQATSTTNLVVSNTAPTITLPGGSTVTEGQLFFLNLGTITDPGTDTVSAWTINWGDGTTTTGTGNPAGLTRTHAYANEGNFTITVDLVDEDGTHIAAGTKVVAVTNVGSFLTGTLADQLVVDNNNNGQADAGDVIEYTATVINNGPDNATNVMYTANLDPNQTLIAPTGTAPVNAVVFTDDFNRAASTNLGPNWTEQFFNTEIDSNRFEGVDGSLVNLATVNTVWESDVRVESSYDLTPTAPDFNHIGLVARYQGAGDQNMYAARVWTVNGSVFADILRNINGNWVSLTGTFINGGLLIGTMRFEAIGTALRLFVNNNLVLQTVDSTFREGRVGLRLGNRVGVDNFVVTRLASPSFTDNFNRADSASVGESYAETAAQAGAGDFSVISNKLQGVGGFINIASLTTTAITDVSVKADVNIVGSGFEHAGLMARYQGSGSGGDMYVGLVFRSGSQDFAMIYKQFNGGAAVLDIQPIAVATGTLRFDVVGNTLKLFLNEAMVGSAIDSSIQGPGLAGVRSSNQTYDNLSVTPASSNVGYTDNFNRVGSIFLGSHFKETVGDVSIISNRSVATGSGAINTAVLNDAWYSDVAVQADVNLIVSGLPHQGVVARYQGVGDSDMYAGIIYNFGSGPQLAIFRNLSGSWTQLTPIVNAPSSAGTLRLEVVGSSLRLFFNGNLVGSATDTTIKGPGLAGMRSGNSQSMDNFSVTPLAGDAYLDQFNRANTSDLGVDYSELLGDMAIVSNQLQPTGPGTNLTINNKVQTADVEVFSSVTLNGPGSQADLVARYSGPGDSNMYIGRLTNVGGTFFAQILRNVAGTTVQLASAQVGAGTGFLNFQVQGNSLRLLLGGNLAVSATDNMLRAPGLTGMRGTAGVNFDLFQATPIAQSRLSTGIVAQNLGTLTPGQSVQTTYRTTVNGVLNAYATQVGHTGTVTGTDSGTSLPYSPVNTNAVSRMAIAAPDLRVGITGPSETLISNTITYTLTYTNLGTQDDTDVNLRVAFASGANSVMMALQGGSSFGNGAAANWTQTNGSTFELSAGNVPVRGTFTVTLVVRVNQGLTTPVNMTATANIFDIGVQGADLNNLDNQAAHTLTVRGPNDPFGGI